MLFALFLSGCETGDDEGDGNGGGPGPEITRAAREGDARTPLLGFSAIPAEVTQEGYIQAFATAAEHGDIVLIQRTPPWEDFLPGGGISQATRETTQLETDLLEQYGHLQLFYAIDPTDGVVQRSRIANLPAGIDANVGFNDPRLREAFIQYTTYVIKTYEPDYLALGVEVNMLYERKPEQFAAFLSLYKEAYGIAKANRPETKVFPTFQLEDLEGTLAEIHPPHWEVVDAFDGVMDVLAISTYPYMGDVPSVADIRADYLSQLVEHFDGEVIISETAYPSAPVEGKRAVGTPEEQQAYLTRLLTEAQELGFGAVIWLASRDPAFASTGVAGAIKDVGLRRADGSNKIAWGLWEAWARRPVAASP